MQNALTLPNSQNLLFSPYAVPGMNRELIGNKTAMYILEMVSKSLNVSIPNILGYSRIREKVIARQIAQYLLRTKIKMQYKPIGKLFNRDHTTVIHSVKFIKGQINLKHQPDIVTHLRNIENQLKW